MGMTRMDVEIRIPIYEIEGDDKAKDKGNIVVSSHWNRTSDLVVLTVAGKSYTVAIDALSKAVAKAMF